MTTTGQAHSRVVVLSALLAFGAPDGHAAEVEVRAVFETPLSLTTKLITAVEANGLAQLGQSGLTEFVIKPVPGISVNAFRSFDNSLVISANGGKLSAAALQSVRTLLAEGVRASGFEIIEPQQSQAGIATILSPFRAPSGRVTWELMLVVFDREKFQAPAVGAAQSAVLASVFKSAVRGIVVHLYPETNLDLTQEVLDSTTHDGLRTLFNRGLTHFMKPLATEPPSIPPREP